MIQVNPALQSEARPHSGELRFETCRGSSNNGDPEHLSHAVQGAQNRRGRLRNDRKGCVETRLQKACSSEARSLMRADNKQPLAAVHVDGRQGYVPVFAVCGLHLDTPLCQNLERTTFSRSRRGVLDRRGEWGLGVQRFGSLSHAAVQSLASIRFGSKRWHTLSWKTCLAQEDGRVWRHGRGNGRTWHPPAVGKHSHSSRCLGLWLSATRPLSPRSNRRRNPCATGCKEKAVKTELQGMYCSLASTCHPRFYIERMQSRHVTGLLSAFPRTSKQKLPHGRSVDCGAAGRTARRCRHVAPRGNESGRASFRVKLVQMCPLTVRSKRIVAGSARSAVRLEAPSTWRPQETTGRLGSNAIGTRLFLQAEPA